MLPDTDDSAIQADAYIDALLTAHDHQPSTAPDAGARLRDERLREAIDLLERGLPRFHPSFLFEDWLAGQLRRAATRGAGETADGRPLADVLPIGLMPRPPQGPAWVGDRRLWVGGAVASGVSIGVAMFAWRRRRD
jgi:hypothetical protein